MADAKVSELSSVATVGSNDLIYLVQGGTSKKASIANVFSSVSNVTFTGNVSFSGTPQTLSSPGIISLNTPITLLQCDAVGGTLNITAGLPGQLKYVVMSSSDGGSYVLNNANISGNVTVTFDNVGDTATLLYYTKWYVVGGTANVTY